MTLTVEVGTATPYTSRWSEAEACGGAGSAKRGLEASRSSAEEDAMEANRFNGSEASGLRAGCMEAKLLGTICSLRLATWCGAQFVDLMRNARRSGCCRPVVDLLSGRWDREVEWRNSQG